MAKFNSGKNIFAVIQCQKVKEKEVLARLDKDASFVFGRGRYAYILHDKDVLDSGEIKGKHIHLVLCADVAKSSDNWIEHFSRFLEVGKDAISVEIQGNEKKCIRYLLHLDDGAKHQYDRSEVFTNMPDVCKKAWADASQFVSNPTLEQLLKAAEEGSRGVFNLVGLNGYLKAQKVLDDLRVEDARQAKTIESVERDWKEKFDNLQAVMVAQMKGPSMATLPLLQCLMENFPRGLIRSELVKRYEDMKENEKIFLHMDDK